MALVSSRRCHEVWVHWWYTYLLCIMSSRFSVVLQKAAPSFYYRIKFYCMLYKFPNLCTNWWICRVSTPVGLWLMLQWMLEWKHLAILISNLSRKYPSETLLFHMVVLSLIGRTPFIKAKQLSCCLLHFFYVVFEKMDIPTSKRNILWCLFAVCW